MASSQTPLSGTEKIQYFSVTLFGAVLGYAGLTHGLLNSQRILGLPIIYSQVLTVITILIFIAIASTYLIKTIKFPQSVLNELNHPVTMNFFASITLALILISALLLPVNYTLATTVFYLGATGHLFFTFYLMRSWLMHEKWEIQQMNPAWFIPIVGNVTIPMVGINIIPIELNWFFFSIGFIFWLVLQAIILYRLFFHPPMLQTLEPTLFILIAPPALSFLSYTALLGDQPIDPFARVLFYTALFYTLLLASQINRFIKIPFSLSWWAYTFPLATIGNASLIMYEKLQMPIFAVFGGLVLSVLAALILHLTLKTFKAIKNNQLCVAPK